MNLLRIIVIIFFSFPNLKAQNYTELLTMIDTTKIDSIKLNYLFNASLRANNINEFHQVLPNIFLILSKKHIAPSPYYRKHPKSKTYYAHSNLNIPLFNKKQFFSFKTYKKLKESAPLEISRRFLELIGLQYAYQRNISKATKIAEILIEQDAKNPAPYLVLGQLYFYHSRKPDQGLSNYIKVLQLDSTYSSISKKIAVKLAMESYWLSDSEYSTEYIMLHTPSYYKDHDSARIQNNLSKAIKYIDNALRFDSSNSLYLKLKGDFLLAKLKEEEALEFYFKSIHIDSNYVAIKRVISIYKENDSYQKGIDLYTKYMLPYYKFEFKIGRAYLYYLNKNYAKSLEEIQALSFNEPFYDVYYPNREELKQTSKYLIGANYARSQKYLQAIRYLQDIDKPFYWGPLKEEFYFALALAYYKTNKAPKKKLLQLLNIALLFDNNPEYLALKSKVETIE